MPSPQTSMVRHFLIRHVCKYNRQQRLRFVSQLCPCFSFLSVSKTSANALLSLSQGIDPQTQNMKGGQSLIVKFWDAGGIKWCSFWISRVTTSLFVSKKKNLRSPLTCSVRAGLLGVSLPHHPPFTFFPSVIENRVFSLPISWLWFLLPVLLPVPPPSYFPPISTAFLSFIIKEQTSKRW